MPIDRRLPKWLLNGRRPGLETHDDHPPLARRANVSKVCFNRRRWRYADSFGHNGNRRRRCVAWPVCVQLMGECAVVRHVLRDWEGAMELTLAFIAQCQNWHSSYEN